MSEMNEQAQSVEARLHALERRFVRAIALGVAVLAGLAGCMALSATQASDQVIRARRIELVDSAGRVRMVLSAELEGPGVAGLKIFGAEDEASLRVYAGTMTNPSGAKQILSMVEVESNAGAGDSFAIAHLLAAKQGAGVFAGFDDQRSVNLFASESSTEINLGIDKDISDETRVSTEYVPLITLSEKDGAPRVRMQAADGSVLFEKP
jgi:hypothetical protein